MVRSKTTSLVVLVSAVALLALLTAPVWRWLWSEWWSNDYYSHGVLILPIALFLAWRRLRNAGELSWSSMQGDNRGLLLLAFSLAAYLFLLTDKALYLAAFAMIGIVAGLVWTLGGSVMARRLVFPLAFLALMIPLPFIERATLPLAQFTGLCSGTLMSWLGLDVTVNGVAVTLPNADLVIGAQCSGINSMITLLTLTTLLAYIFEGPLWGRLMLVLLAVPLALAGNIVRVANLLVVARHVGIDTAFDFYHNYSGIVVFFLALLLMIPITRLLQCRTVRAEVL